MTKYSGRSGHPLSLSIRVCGEGPQRVLRFNLGTYSFKEFSVLFVEQLWTYRAMSMSGRIQPQDKQLINIACARSALCKQNATHNAAVRIYSDPWIKTVELERHAY